MKKIIDSIEKVNFDEMEKCEKILDSKMKPLGSLGVLEKLAIQISGIIGSTKKEIKNGCHFVISSDNGIVEEGISSCPLEYTKIVSEAMLNKIAAIGILCDSLNIQLNVVDIGIKGDILKEYPNLYRKKISRGTKNFLYEPAMTYKEMKEAIETGIELIKEKKDFDFFSNGEMGIGNTTTSSAILYCLTDSNIDEVVGRGGGLSDKDLKKKKNIIIEACRKYNLKFKNPLEVLCSVGGFDIACMVGMYLGAAMEKKPILIDGFISSVAALVAVKLDEKVRDYVIATHMSEEPGMKVVMKELKKTPFLNMEMRLGEGTGAVLAYPIIKSAIRILHEMKTKEEVYDIFKK